MADVVLQGERVLIRPVEPDDAERLLTIRTSPGVSRWWDPPGPGWPMNQTDSHRFTVLLDDDVIGFIQWYEHADPEYRHAGIDVFIDSARHGQGLGRESVSTVLRHLLDDVGHHRVVIDPAADNTAAIRCYRACGFRVVGTMLRYQRDPVTDTWHDGLLMEYVVDPVTGAHIE